MERNEKISKTGKLSHLVSKKKKVEKEKQRKNLKRTKKIETKNAVLGGGDIGFPLLFSGVIMKGLMLENLFFIGFLKTLIIPVFATLSLMLLFMLAKKNKFYPAMPFLTLGCAAGYGVLILVEILILL